MRICKLKPIFQNKYLFYFLLVQIIGVYYFAFLGDHGPYLMRDSSIFISPNTFVAVNYALYTKFLAFCRTVVGEQYFLNVVFIIQVIFALITSWTLTEFLRTIFNLNYLQAASIYIMTMLPYGYSLPENVTTHHIMTEGLSIPFFQICILYSLKILLDYKNKYLGCLLIANMLLILTRLQLIVIEPALVFLIVFAFYKKNKKAILKILTNKRIKKNIIITLTVFTSIFLCGAIYIFRFTNIESQLLTAISGRVLCLMEYDDRVLFEDEDRKIYDYVYEKLDQGQHLEPYFREDSWRSYDIGFHTNENTKKIIPFIREYYREQDSLEIQSDYALQSYYDRDNITRKILIEHIGGYLENTISLMVESMVVSVFIQPDRIRNICYILAFIIYVFSLMLYGSARFYYKIENKYLVVYRVTLLYLLSNVLFTNLIFYGHQRYMIYTFGMYYISNFLLLIGIYRNRKKKFR